MLTLSAVKFDRFAPLDEDGKPVGQEYSARLSIPDQILKGRKVDAGTIEWWQKQSKDAQDAAFFGDTVDVKEALNGFFKFAENTQPFCRGTDFDPPIIHSLCRDYGVRSPIKYNQYRDVRTYIDALTGQEYGYLKGWDAPDWLIPHNSLHDCWKDAIQMVLAPYSNKEKL